jgi:hypothetical protein
MTDALVIRRAELPVGRDRVEALRAFYADWGALGDWSGGVSLPAGSGEIAFVPATGQPFHHFALLVPGGRFEAARTWVAERAPLLAEPDSTETTFVFDDWDALACYVADPAGNIVELIAHAELCPSHRTGRFDPEEFCAISEMGLVVDNRQSALQGLAERGIELWAGSDGPGGLSFVGRKGHTLILVAPGRGWLPTGEPAQRCPATVTVTVDGGRELSLSVAGGELAA